ncbi:MAG: FkbM family methyltransferase [Ignavibacteriales bacterium]|nr:FkbM family methyltransferase [Ignavibacteriales bacterium]
MNSKILLKKVLPRTMYVHLRSLSSQRKRTLSQLGQDFWVFGEAFNGMRRGFFVEVGSADGILFSNTFLLEKRYGWTGICIEPDPLFFQDLRRVRSAKCLNVCVDAREGEVEFAQRDLFGGIVSEDTDNPRDVVERVKPGILRLPARPLVSILRSESAPQVIDYLSIDVEGAEERILCDFPFNEYLFRCMTVERPKARLRNVLDGNGYKAVKEIPHHDIFYVHESFYPEYEKNIFQFWGKYQT